MHNRHLFREHGHVIHTHRRMAGAAWPLLACLLLLGLLAWGHAVDAESDRADQVDAALAAGRLLGKLDMAETVGDAYRMGQREALCAKGQP